MYLKDDVHCQLDIALAKPPDDTRKHVRREGRAFYPAIRTSGNQFTPSEHV